MYSAREEGGVGGMHAIPAALLGHETKGNLAHTGTLATIKKLLQEASRHGPFLQQLLVICNKAGIRRCQ